MVSCLSVTGGLCFSFLQKGSHYRPTAMSKHIPDAMAYLLPQGNERVTREVAVLAFSRCRCVHALWRMDCRADSLPLISAWTALKCLERGIKVVVARGQNVLSVKQCSPGIQQIHSPIECDVTGLDVYPRFICNGVSNSNIQ